MKKKNVKFISLIFTLAIMLMFFVGNDEQNEEIPYEEETEQYYSETVNVESDTVSNDELTSYLLSLEYDGSAYKVINNGVPYFSETYSEEFEDYSDLDELGRCGTAFASISPETLPTEERGSISGVKPSGWHTYNSKEMFGQNLIDNTFYIYNRSHLIAYSLAGENANEKNLVTGTRYMNIAMTDFEEEVCNYVKETGNHVLYRSTPVFNGDNLVCNGILLEARSVETDDIEFCVYIFNVQLLEDGTVIDIDYSTGEVIY